MLGNSVSIKNKAASGVIYLTVKRLVLQIIFTSSNIFLARLLSPADFGIYAIVGSIGIFLNVFSDLGLVPALIQKKGEIEKVEVRTAFTVQLCIGLFLMLLTIMLAGPLSSFFNLGEAGIKLLGLYSLVFMIAPFKQIPSAYLERNLEYKKIVIIELLGILVNSGLTVLLAYLGFGVYSFIWGFIVGNIVSALLLCVFSGFAIGISFKRDVLVKLAKFGLPYQTQIFFGLFYGPLILMYLSKAVSQENLGYYQFAVSISVFPLAFSEILNRVIFPLGARVQTDKAFLKSAIERSVSLVSMVTLPTVFLIGAMLIHIINLVYTDKWLPALPALYLGIVQMVIVAYTSIFSQFLLSQGRAATVRNMTLIWAVLSWILAPILIAKFDFLGMNLTNLLVSVSGMWLFWQLRKDFSFDFGKNFFIYFVCSFVCALVVILVFGLLPQSLLYLAFSILVGLGTYALLLWIFVRDVLKQNLAIVLSLVFRDRTF